MLKWLAECLHNLMAIQKVIVRSFHLQSELAFLKVFGHECWMLILASPLAHTILTKFTLSVKQRLNIFLFYKFYELQHPSEFMQIACWTLLDC